MVVSADGDRSRDCRSSLTSRRRE